MFLRSIVPAGPSPSVWSAQAEFCAHPREVLDALTDPRLIARWAPVDFEVEGLAQGPLRTGSRERVSGVVAGLRTNFDVEVARADEQRLELVAKGPFCIDVAYRFAS